MKGLQCAHRLGTFSCQKVPRTLWKEKVESPVSSTVPLPSHLSGLPRWNPPHSVQGKGQEGAVRSPVNPLLLSSRVSAQVSLEKPPPFVPHVHQVTGGRPQRGRGL